MIVLKFIAIWFIGILIFHCGILAHMRYPYSTVPKLPESMTEYPYIASAIFIIIIFVISIL